MNNEPIFEVSDAIAVLNQSLEYAFPAMTVVGEVSSFKINQGKWVFFDLKDDEGSLGCFMSLFNLRVQIEDGMKIMVVARPRLTNWGKFSLTVEQIKPVGEGSLKKAYELLLAKLDKEGLFAPERKRALPWLPQKIGVISSTDAAGYKDFIKILGQRFGGLEIEVFHTLVQGLDAPAQIIRGVEYFNESVAPPDVIAILRGGGSADDLVAFNDEPLVRKIAASRVPVITGIGHEVDTTLADLAADVRASTPSNAAEILLPDKREIAADLDARLGRAITSTQTALERAEKFISDNQENMRRKIDHLLENTAQRLNYLTVVLRQLDPKAVLNRGYALVRNVSGNVVNSAKIGEKLTVESSKVIMKVEVENVTEK